MIESRRGCGYGMREKPPHGAIGDLQNRVTVQIKTASTCDGNMRNGKWEGTKGSGAMLLVRTNCHLFAKFQVRLGFVV